MGQRRSADWIIRHWLMEPDSPSVRYWTIRDFGLAEDAAAARAAIPDSPVVRKVMARQADGGYWGDPDSPYLPKYKATYWTLMLLGYLGLSREDDRIRRAVEYILRFQQPDGGFAASSEAQAQEEYRRQVARSQSRGRPVPEETAYIADQIHQETLSCLTGNTVAALLRFGYGDDARVRRALQWLTGVQNADGGWLCPYWRAHVRDTHGCMYGTIAALEAFASVPYDRRPPAMEQAIAHGAEFLLMHRLYLADHHDMAPIKADWLTLHFPWFYGYDILRGLWVLNQLGYFVSEEPRLADALDVLAGKMTPQGLWVLEKTPRGRMWANLERKGAPSKWITLRALWVMANTLD